MLRQAQHDSHLSPELVEGLSFTDTFEVPRVSSLPAYGLINRLHRDELIAAVHLPRVAYKIWVDGGSGIPTAHSRLFITGC